MGCCYSHAVDNPANKSKKVTFGPGVHKGNFIKTTRGNVRDHFDIIRTIGSGGFGTVFKVIDRRTGNERAIKEIPKSRLDPDAEKQMLLEVEILKEMVNIN